MMPSQKLGMLIPKRPRLVPRLSIHELGRAPAQTPSGTARETAIRIEKSASSIVAGNLCAMTSLTGAEKRKDLPKSPVAAERTNLTYWT